MESPRTVLLLRHGETEWNAAGRLQGRGDSPLTARGRGEAESLARACAAHGVRRVVTSPLGRARATAVTIAQACGAALEVADPLVEIDFGACSGLTLDEARSRHGAYWRAREADPWRTPWPGGECYADAAARGRDWWHAAGAPWARPPLAVVAHGAFLRALRQVLTAEPEAEARAMLLGGGRYWEVTEAGVVFTRQAVDAAGTTADPTAHP